MKIVCSIGIGNRLLPTLAVSSKTKHVKSTLALCKHPKSEEYCIIHFTNQNKTGVKYAVKGNISQILTKFINDGKTTIQFKAPPHDMFITGDIIQLKGFLHLLKRVLQNKVAPNELIYSSLGVTPVPLKAMPPTKLIIKSRGEYPTKGFPRTLESLYINGIRRCALDNGILNLVRLRVLDLSDNCIETLPEALNKLPNLNELNLSGNHFHKSTWKQWSWLGGNLSKSLQLLNLSANNLRFVPDQIRKLHQLVSLIVACNQLTLLPSGIGHLRRLRVLDASSNSISVLPGSIRNCRLQVLKLSENNFPLLRENHETARAPKSLPVLSLKDISAKKVLELRLPYSAATIPYTLVDRLDLAKYCVCGSACFEVFIRDHEWFSVSAISNEYVLSSGTPMVLPLDCHFCSMRCFRTNHARHRAPLT